MLGAEAHLAEGDPLQPQYLTDELMRERVRDQERRRHIERVKDEERVRGDLFVVEMRSLEGERERGLQGQFEWDRRKTDRKEQMERTETDRQRQTENERMRTVKQLTREGDEEGGRERSIETEEVKERAMERELQNFGEGGSTLLNSTKIPAESQHAYNRETIFSDGFRSLRREKEGGEEGETGNGAGREHWSQLTNIGIAGVYRGGVDMWHDALQQGGWISHTQGWTDDDEVCVHKT